MRRGSLIFVTGTGTEVGKTWVAARLLEGLREQEVRVEARKPVQSFAPGSGPTDAELLAAAADCLPDHVCPPHRSYPIPLAPPIAAEQLGSPAFTIAELRGELRLPAQATGVIEGAGGWRSPLAADGDSRALAQLIEPDLAVLVAPTQLGAIHAVRSCLDSMDDLRLCVFLNRYDATQPEARSGLAWLRERDGLDVVVDTDALVQRVCGLRDALAGPGLV